MATTQDDPRSTLSSALARQGLRLTGPRRAVLDVLAARPGPLSVAELHARLRPRRVNLVSVYRTVHLLEAVGLVRTADTSRGIQRYELAEQFTGHHHHLICEQCGGVQDLDGCLLAEQTLAMLERELRRSQRFQLTGHDLKLFGRCHRCRAR
jgi:Fe2+ or Zn2+ uptake regulation protein